MMKTKLREMSGGCWHIERQPAGGWEVYALGEDCSEDGDLIAIVQKEGDAEVIRALPDIMSMLHNVVGALKTNSDREIGYAVSTLDNFLRRSVL